MYGYISIKLLLQIQVVMDHIWPAGHNLPTLDLCKTNKNCIARDLSVCALITVFNGLEFVLCNSCGEGLSKYSYWQTVWEIYTYVAPILE